MKPGRDLDLGSTAGVQCEPAVPDGPVAFAFNVALNKSSRPLVLKRVELVGSEGLKLVGAYIAPVTKHTLLGVSPGWPPAGQRSDPAFVGKRSLKNAQFPADTKIDQAPQILLRLQKDREDASFAYYKVIYTQGGDSTERYARTHVRLDLKSHC